MTAKELIDRLAQLPPDTPVCVRKDCDYGDTLIDEVKSLGEPLAAPGDDIMGDWRVEADLVARCPSPRKVVVLE